MNDISPSIQNNVAQQKLLVIGIVGGIASGKSVATETLERLGAHVLYADRIAHHVLRDPEVIQQIVTLFGESVLAADSRSELERKKIASLTFGDEPGTEVRRKALEAIVQPRIRDELQKRIDQWKRDPVGAALILDIPLLMEREWDRQCDRILMIQTPIERRIQFAAERGWSEADHAARESAQWSMEKKRQAATDCIDNVGSRDQLEQRVKTWFQSLSK